MDGPLPRDRAFLVSQKQLSPRTRPDVPTATSYTSPTITDRIDDDDETKDEAAARVVVPWDRLSPAALRGVIEEFVTREGTEHGATDVSLEAKVAQVRRQLERGDVVVLFDAASGTVNLASARDAQRALERA